MGNRLVRISKEEDIPELGGGLWVDVNIVNDEFHQFTIMRGSKKIIHFEERYGHLGVSVAEPPNKKIEWYGYKPSRRLRIGPFDSKQRVIDEVSCLFGDADGLTWELEQVEVEVND